MNILYITPSFPRKNEGENLYIDLAQEINKKHKIVVAVSEEKKSIDKTSIGNERGIQVLRVKCGNLYNVSFLEKGITYITMQKNMKNAIKRYLKEEKFDLILFMAPPVTLGSVVKYAMKKYNAKSYLMQKDIFPQNSLDLGILSRKNPMYYYFKFKEKRTYKVASKIGCMTEGNIDFLKAHNKWLDKNKLELFPNTIALKNIENNKINIRSKYNIDEDKVIAIYGGNFGKPQGVDFIKEVLKKYKNDNRIVFFFIGKGTEKEKLFRFIKDEGLNNVISQDYIPRDEYEEILKQSDIGLVFLDYRFTIPNIPSRTLAYFEYGLPIMAATDKNTDYKKILVDDAKAGLWCESNNIEEFKKQFDYLINNKEERIQMGRNGREYLEKNWTVSHSVNILENAYKNMKGESQNE